MRESYKALLDLAASKNLADSYKARIEEDERAVLSTLERSASTHSRLQVNWRCRGAGSFYNQKRGKIHATYEITLVEDNVSKERIDQQIAAMRAIIEAGAQWKASP